MRAQVLLRHGDTLVEREVSPPAPGPGEVLVKVEACGVGLTVLNYMRGVTRAHPAKLPRIPGHEAVGTVVDLGAGVGEVSAGDRVMAYFYLSCGMCDFCRLAHEPLCRTLRGQVGVDTDGGYAEYMVMPARNALRVPSGLGPVEATAIPDAVATSFHVSRRAGIGPGDTVVVVGAAGGVGIHMVQMARAFGADVVGLEVGSEKVQALQTLGVQAVDFREPDLVPRLRSAAPGGITVAVDLVGREETLEACVEVLDPRGRLVLLTTFAGASFPVSPARMVLGELSFIGSRYASRWEVQQAARMVQEGKVRPVVSDVRPFGEVNALLNKLQSGTLIGRGAILPGGMGAGPPAPGSVPELPR